MKKTLHGKPKAVIFKLFDEAGGMLGVTSSSEMPRNCHQIYNIQHSSVSHSTGEKPNPIFKLLQQCKTDLMLGAGRKFIRSVNLETSPSCVIATDTQLQNVRFCTNQSRTSFVLGIDQLLIWVNFMLLSLLLLTCML